MSIPSRADVDRIIMDRLSTDPAFREALLADPRGVLSAAIGLSIPETVTLTVHEESLTDIHLVIPVSVDDEIAEEDLNLVAGGHCWNENTCLGGK